ncbi:MAG TPA: hypothetical protein DCL95_00015 [Rhodospirillaceae bacterium]|nr:hypothetical protein [Rhodospirillaceae bacterium]
MQLRPFVTGQVERDDLHAHLDEGLQGNQGTERIIISLQFAGEKRDDQQHRDGPGGKLPAPSQQRIEHRPIDFHSVEQSTRPAASL